ncbi:hypothetical protein GUJ93_ZPchr0013g37522 [Zizania palustris]|uniref:Uncharacterized protein n=1 Tax=Zizania palustris TaxID=103762 RepID=A0A8J5WRY2_ZIZPA|nr:hypothetical protein GUJ93_ZPchr0013g37522 [Zizania palustris]
MSLVFLELQRFKVEARRFNLVLKRSIGSSAGVAGDCQDEDIVSKKSSIDSQNFSNRKTQGRECKEIWQSKSGAWSEKEDERALSKQPGNFVNQVVETNMWSILLSVGVVVPLLQECLRKGYCDLCQEIFKSGVEVLRACLQGYSRDLFLSHQCFLALFRSEMLREFRNFQLHGVNPNRIRSLMAKNCNGGLNRININDVLSLRGRRYLSNCQVVGGVLVTTS